ncbi:MAG: hypothetical protein WC486_01490 [Candidatus Omnitrophota bacterium]|nr:hypothetical protein [Candidatus Omnitrophota bacterium]
MSEHSEHKDLMPPPPDRQDVLLLIKQVQQQLNFLEKKIDLLVAQTQGRPQAEQSFSKPFRSFSHHRRFDRGQSDPRGEKSFDRGFGHKRKSFDDARENGPDQGRRFEKRYSSGQSGFGQTRRKKHGFSR